MKTKGLSKKDREILSRVKKEMDRPRLTTSVRYALEAAAELAAITQVVHLAKA